MKNNQSQQIKEILVKQTNDFEYISNLDDNEYIKDNTSEQFEENFERKQSQDALS